MENSTVVPPSLGAPLDTSIIFQFNPSKALPLGPFNQSTLPVFTTPSEVTSEAFPPDGTSPILAKGSYVSVGHTVEFRPTLPTDPLCIKLSCDPASVPGLLPGSVYTARVTTIPGLGIPNLVGGGGQVKFGTTSNPTIYFSSGQGDGKPPSIVSTSPLGGTSNVYPGLYSNLPAGSSQETFIPKGPEAITLVYDRGIAPDVNNLAGLDWDHDGLKDPPQAEDRPNEPASAPPQSGCAASANLQPPTEPTAGVLDPVIHDPGHYPAPASSPSLITHHQPATLLTSGLCPLQPRQPDTTPPPTAAVYSCRDVHAPGVRPPIKSPLASGCCRPEPKQQLV
jgi:hypothetical protein